MAGPEAGNACLFLEVVGHPVVSLLHAVGGHLDLQAFLARGDVFNSDIHGGFKPKSDFRYFNPYLEAPGLA